MKVLANDGFSLSGIALLKEAGMEVLEHRVAEEQLANFINANEIEVLLVRSATKVKRTLIESCPGLRVIGRAGVGLDNIDVEYAESKGIKVMNTPGASSRSVAELIFAHFLSLARFLHESNRLMPLEGDKKFNQLKKSFANGMELAGKILGVIGFGNIGKEVVKLGISFGMNIKVLSKQEVSKTITLDFFDGQKMHFDISTTINPDEFYPDIDFLSINVPQSNSYIVDASELEKLKSGAIIVNASRGGVLNEAALMRFISQGKIMGAGLDVFENEPIPELSLLMNPALSLSPHLGGSTIDAQEKISIELAKQIIEYQTK